MAYKISSLDDGNLEKKKYFFDSNLWLFFLKGNPNPSNRQLKYLDFFEKFKNHTSHPKIVVTSLVLSEVINRYLREVSMNRYIRTNNITGISPGFYKEIFRKTPEFKIAYDVLCNDIKGYHHFYELVSDGLGESIKSKHILSSPPQGLDFNDHYYYQFAKKKEYTIVTDDADFFVEDVEVLTFNDKLIQRAKDSITPKK